MKAIVDHDTCIGCGQCAMICPAVFQMSDSKCTVIQKPIAEENIDCSREAAETCPVSAITLI